MKRRLAVVVGLFALTQPLSRAAAETPTEKRLRVLEEQLRKAQEDIQELKGQIEQQRAAGQATQKQAERAEVEAKTATAAQKGLVVPDWLKRVTIVGDVRARHEGFYHQPHARGTPAVTARNRERIRGRLGVKVAFSDEVSAMIRGASGNPDDPVVTNEDLTGSFTRKHFNLDWAYLTFTPGQHGPYLLNVTPFDGVDHGATVEVTVSGTNVMPVPSILTTNLEIVNGGQ